jgi:hypothetical protein
MHVHPDVDEYVVVLSGTLRCRIDGRTSTSAPATRRSFPAGSEHTFTNLADEPCEMAWVVLGRLGWIRGRAVCAGGEDAIPARSTDANVAAASGLEAAAVKNNARLRTQPRAMSEASTSAPMTARGGAFSCCE